MTCCSKDLPITASVRGNWDDCLRPWMDEYGLEHPQRNPVNDSVLMERMDPATIVWLRSLPLLEKKEVGGFSSLICLTKLWWGSTGWE